MNVREFLWSIAVRKGLKELVKVAVTVFGTKYAADFASVGVRISLDEAAILAASAAGLEVARNILKQKFGMRFL